MNAVWFSLFLAICGAIYFLKQNPSMAENNPAVKEDKKLAPTCESISSIQSILDKYRISKKYEYERSQTL